MTSIILSTLNARYSHASLGLRYLAANMGTLESHTKIMEFTIQHTPFEIAERVLLEEPVIVGFGIYIWNVEETFKVVSLLKTVRPELIVVLGGPEVSYEWDSQPIVALADYVITGWGDISFGKLCDQLLSGTRPSQKIITGEQPPLNDIKLPYHLYDEEDVANRLIYVEASRGCPFKCEFCLSSLDKTAWPFDLDAFLADMAKLYDRGVRQFKFVDRTFNLNIKTSLRILEFFLERLDEKLFVHFEVVPDHLPEKLREAIIKFPDGVLQFEVGIQTFNPEVQTLISRKQDNEKAEQNLRWLHEKTHAHIHADLIIGLPGEDVESFAKGFNRLVALNPGEIQVGILKRLRGTPISRHTETYGMRYNPNPPYNILSNDRIDFITMQRLSRFARYWEMIANSGKFTRGLALLLDDNPFGQFMKFSDWLWHTTGKTHQIALDRLFDFVYQGMTEELGINPAQTATALSKDYETCGARGCPQFMRNLVH